MDALSCNGVEKKSVKAFLAICGTCACSTVGDTSIASIKSIDVESLLAGKAGSRCRADRTVQDDTLWLTLIDDRIVLLGAGRTYNL